MSDSDSTPLEDMHDALLRARQVAAFLQGQITGARRDRLESLTREIDAAVGTLHGLAVELAEWNSVRRRLPRRRDGFAFDVLATLDADEPTPRRAYAILPGLWQLRDKRETRFCMPGRNAALSRLAVRWPDGVSGEATVTIEAWRPAAAEFRLGAAARQLERTARWKGYSETDLLIAENALLDWDATGTPVPLREFRLRAATAEPTEPPSGAQSVVANSKPPRATAYEAGDCAAGTAEGSDADAPACVRKGLADSVLG